MPNLIEVKVAEVVKTLNTKRAKGADGKPHTVRTATQKVEFTYPALNPLAVSTAEDLHTAIDLVLGLGLVGFVTPRQLAEHVAYGLYNNARGVVARGADARYTGAQRRAMRMFGEMARDGLLLRQPAIDGLLRQGVTDAEEVIDGWIAGKIVAAAEETPADAATNGVTV